jgi:hypothetical protein
VMTDPPPLCQWALPRQGHRVKDGLEELAVCGAPRDTRDGGQLLGRRVRAETCIIRETLDDYLTIEW